MNVILRILFVLLFLSSCTDKRTKDYERIMKPIVKIKTNDQEVRVYDGITEPAFPDFEENDKTIMGIDANKDGVRDDIEIYINRTYEKANVRRALKQYVLNKTGVLQLNDNVEGLEVLESTEKSLTTLNCISFVHPNNSQHLRKDLNRLILNTALREEKFNYLHHRIAAGTMIGVVDRYGYEQWDKYCNFQIEDYEKTSSEFLNIYDVYMGKKRDKK